MKLEKEKCLQHKKKREKMFLKNGEQSIKKKKRRSTKFTCYFFFQNKIKYLDIVKKDIVQILDIFYLKKLILVETVNFNIK